MMVEIGRPDSWYERDEPNTKTYEVVKILTFEVEAVDEDEAKELADPTYTDYYTEHTEVTQL